MMCKKFYAGIGSRETPPDVQIMMAEIASHLEDKGFTLRSGNAHGADTAFASGVKVAAQIWLPWKRFNPDFQASYPEHDYIVIGTDEEAEASIEKYHPRPKSLGTAARKLMSRNYRQIIGKDGEPNSEFVICWTPKGQKIGGTSQAWRIADDYGIRVINLYNCSNALQFCDEFYFLNP